MCLRGTKTKKPPKHPERVIGGCPAEKYEVVLSDYHDMRVAVKREPSDLGCARPGRIQLRLGSELVTISAIAGGLAAGKRRGKLRVVFTNESKNFESSNRERRRSSSSPPGYRSEQSMRRVSLTIHEIRAEGPVGGLQNQVLVHEFSKSDWNRDALCDLPLILRE